MSVDTAERPLEPAPSTRAILGAARVFGTRLPALQIVLLVGLFLYGSFTIQGYSSRFSIYAMLVIGSLYGIAAMGQTLVILLGGIDLSVPAIIGAANVMAAQLTGGDGWPLPAVVVFVLVLAAAVGGLNGYLSHRFDVHPLIITLATGAAVGGGVLAWTKAELTGGAPRFLTDFVSQAKETGFVPLPRVVVFWIVLSAALVLVLAKTPVGRRLYATGANARAARLALVSTARVWAGTFAASAVLSALTGVLLAGYSGTGQLDIGDPYLFYTISIVVIGGTSLLGARGDYVRSILGALILTQTYFLMTGNNVGTATQQVVLGAAILVFVATYGREAHVRNRI